VALIRLFLSLFATYGEGPNGTGETDDFRETVLDNLDPDDIEGIEKLEPGEETEILQYWGDYEIRIIIKKSETGALSCIFDGHGPFSVTL
jgi:hypothetical protein